MPTLDRRTRSRLRRANRHRFGTGTESLESRRLLAVAPIDVASGLTFAVALPVAGLATGIGVTAAPTAMSATVSPSVSPAPASGPALAPMPSPFGPSATGPATTLSPLPDDSETAVAPASEVARPTPGRSDRISSFIEPSEIVPIRHLRAPDEDRVVPGPEDRPAPPAAPAKPAEDKAPAEPLPPAPARPAEPAPATEVPKGLQTVGPTDLRAWDAAIEILATDEAEDRPEVDPAPVRHAEVSMAAGVLLAAWYGRKSGARREGRTRRPPLAVATLEAGPGPGDGR